MKIRPKLVDSFIMLSITDLLCMVQIIGDYFINPLILLITVILSSCIIDFFINHYVLEKYDSENNSNYLGYIFSIIAFLICIPLLFLAYGKYF